MRHKKLSLIILLSVVWQCCFSQNKFRDSLIKIINTATSDSIKFNAWSLLSYEYQNYKPDSALLIAQQLYEYSSEKKNIYGQSLAMDGLAGAFFRIGDNSKALEYYLKRLSIEEKRKVVDNLATIYMNIANVYNRNNDRMSAIQYILLADSIINTHNLDYLKLYAYLNTGNILEKAERLDDALGYTRKCFQLASIKHDSLMIGNAMNNLGNIYIKKTDYTSAISYYLRSQPYLRAVNDNQTLSEGFIGLANAYNGMNLKDSALYYSKQAYNVSYKNSILENALTASSFLSELYKDSKAYDSAFYYQSMMVGIKDSIQSNEKIKRIESLKLEEQLREQELAAARHREKAENKQRLQLLLIGVAIPFFFLFSIFISRRKIHRRAIQFFGVLSLLLLFEYMTLLIHPFVIELTHHTPLLEILIFVALAAMLVPSHHRIEHWFTKKLAINYQKAQVLKQKAKKVTEVPDNNTEENDDE